MSNVPALEFTPTGLTVPEESAVLAGVLGDYQDAFGGTLNPALETPQGQLASSTAAIIADANAQMALLVNQVDPDTADGFMQDAIARIYFLNRSPGAPTAVACVCVGSPGVIIPVGALAQDTSGNIYQCIQAGVIPVGGSITLQFAHTVNGPVACPADTLNRIYRAIPGWDTINNPAPGVLGRNVETRAEFEFRRANSVAVNAHGSLPSIYAAVFDVPGVSDVYATENMTNATVPTGVSNYPLVAHSLYVAAVGGESAAIAQAIWTKKDVGCNTNGNTTEVVTDPSGYLVPLPTYDIKYEIPAALPVLFEVSILDSPDLPSNVADLVKAAIVSTFAGTGLGVRPRIGSLLTAANFYRDVLAIGPEVQLISILLGDVTATELSLQVGIDQAPTVDDADIVVVLV